MYIEFTLPDHSNQAASNALHIIKKAMQTWSQQYNIPYREKSIKYRYRITFDQDELYSFWAMTWNVDRGFYATSRYRIVSDLNNKI